MKGEPEWMLQFRLKAYQRFLRKPVPKWGGGGSLHDIDFDDIYYYIKPMAGQAKDWDMVPESIKETYEKLGIPEAERKYLAGVTAQYESPRSCTTAIARISSPSACCSATWTPRCGTTPTSCSQYFGTDDPAERQQVRRAQLGGLVRGFVHLRSARCARRPTAPGVLPHQRGEHGPVRAHA
jgi:Fe-S cluster assembly scaffold protein SufB